MSLVLHKHGAWFVLLGLLSIDVGCDGSDTSHVGATGAQCKSGESRLEGGPCTSAGIPPERCAQGFEADGHRGCVPILPSIECADGTMPVIGQTECQPVGLPAGWSAPSLDVTDIGIPPDACAPGFVHDSTYGCDPVLPSEGCPAGQMAVPGESACHVVMDCGTGTWGSIPADLLALSTTRYVRGDYDVTQGASDGSDARPWTTIQAAVDHASSGAVIAIAAGTYVEDVEIYDRPVKLWGRCPALVTVEGSAAALSTIDIYRQSHTEVHGLTATGNAKGSGIGVYDATDVLVDGVIAAHNLQRGVLVQREAHETSATLTASLVEENHGSGVLIGSASLSVRSCVVRDTQSQAGHVGMGFNAYVYKAGIAAALSIDGSVIERNHEAGVALFGSNASITATLLRGNLPVMGDGGGFGIDLERSTDLAPSSLTLDGSVLDQNTHAGLQVAGSSALVTNTVVRGTWPDAALTSPFGHGLVVTTDAMGNPGDLTVERCLIDANTDAGISAIDAPLIVRRSVVRNTVANAAGANGIGIFAVARGASQALELTVEDTLVDHDQSAGIVISGVTATMERVTVQATQPSPLDQADGQGIQLNPGEMGQVGHLDLHDSRIEDNFRAGLVMFDAAAHVTSTLVRGTKVQRSDGHTGRGIDVLFDKGPSDLVVESSRIEGNHDSGISMVGSTLSVRGTIVRSTLADDEGLYGRGIDASSAGAQAGQLTIEASLIEENLDVGVRAHGTSLSLTGSTVRDTLPSPAGVPHGRGIDVSDVAEAETVFTLGSTLVDRNADMGVWVGGVATTLSGSAIRDTAARKDASAYGRGLHVGGSPWHAGALSIEGSLIDTSHEIGLSVHGVPTTLAHSVVRGTRGAVPGLFGDGIFAWEGAALTVTQCLVETSESAGLALYGSNAALEDVLLWCNGSALLSDSFLASDGTKTASKLKDLGGNVCACGEQTFRCVAGAVQLKAPEPVEPLASTPIGQLPHHGP